MYWGPEIGEWDSLTRLFCNCPRVVALDIETVSLKDRSVIGVGVAVGADEAYYFPSSSPYFGEFMMRVVGNPDITKVYHNGIFDLCQLVPMGADAGNVGDTRVMSALLGVPGELKELYSALCYEPVMDRFHIQSVGDVFKEHLPGKKKPTMLDLGYEVVGKKCLCDVLATYRVYERMLLYVDHTYLVREMRLVPMLVKISLRGIRLDQGEVKRLEQKYRSDADIYKMLAKGEGFNPGSAQQVAYFLAHRGNALPMEWDREEKKLKVSTEEAVLRELADPWASLVLEYRHAVKRRSTYVLPWVGAQRAYTTLYFGARTGRLASREANLQNVPEDMRCMFVPDGEWFTEFDASQQELRVMAHVSGDEEMLRIFADPEGDIHQETAEFMRIKRKLAKSINYAMPYGASVKTLAETAQTSVEVAQQLLDRWGEKFKGAWRWMREVREQGLRDGWVETIQGRRIYLPEDEDEDGKGRKAVDYVCQGSGAEWTKEAMLKTQGLDWALQVHDSGLLEGWVSKDELKGMGVEHVGEFHCPIEVKYLRRWGA
jgi:DNA polymerase I-like protein with 3'-5' exonuclease and polymerase domains